MTLFTLIATVRFRENKSLISRNWNRSRLKKLKGNDYVRLANANVLWNLRGDRKYIITQRESNTQQVVTRLYLITHSRNAINQCMKRTLKRKWKKTNNIDIDLVY